MNPRFSIIVPVYNRPAEVQDLAESLLAQSYKDFELIIVEDGSTVPCKDIIENAVARGLNAVYIGKENEGRSIARNHGMEQARGEYFIFFDSDCVIPPDYMRILAEHLDANHVDCFGGPDAAHVSFSNTQKAINFAMTSFLTTGGIRGGKISMEKFTPRTFNMGFSRKVYEQVGGFREMFSEDIDISTRIRRAGFSIVLIREAYVWHKRRVDFGKFARQVYVFGMSRITLHILYPGSIKLVHVLPALFTVAVAAMLLLSIMTNPIWLLPIALYIVLLFASALFSTGSPTVSLLAVPAAFIQLIGYGSGFLYAWFTKIVLGRGRNIDREIQLRKGK